MKGIRQIKGSMGSHRMNIDFPVDDYKYLKKLCAKKGITIKKFVVPLILKAMEAEEDALFAKKAQQHINNMDTSDLILIKDAFKEAGWDTQEM